MKKVLIMVCIATLICFGATMAMAGGMVNKSNLSAKYFGTMTGVARIDGADIAAYNPAGTIMLEPGLTINASAQYLIKKDYENEFADSTTDSVHDTDKESIIPALYVVYKNNGPVAFFGGANVPYGGGKVQYDNGNLVTYQVGTQLAAMTSMALPGSFYTLNSHQIDAESVGISYFLGAAYKVNNWMSISAAGRYLSADVEMEGSASISDALGRYPSFTHSIGLEADASGWGGIFGVDFFPTDQMVIGLRYESRVKLDFDYEVTTDTAGILPALGITSGAKKRDDLPAAVAIGASYTLDKWRFEVNGTMYLNKNADIGGTTLREDPDGDGQGLEEKVDNGYEIGISAEYTINDSWKCSAGYLYTSIGADPQYSSKFLPDLDSHAVGLGLEWKALPSLTLNLSGGNVFYVSDSYIDNTLGNPALGPYARPNMTVEYNKNIPFLAAGIEYKF